MQQGEKAEATATLEAASAASKAGKRPPGRKELDAYTVEQRGQIAFWMDTVAEWREFRRGSGKAEELDRDFVERLKARHPGLQISKATLYRKWQAVRTGDWDSLVENRGKARKGQNSIHPAVWEVFCGIYLQQTKLSVERSMELTEEWAMQNAVNALPLPSAATFQRAVREKIPPETLCFTREGPREWWTLYSPYIARRYGNMVSNQMWVGDTYTLDIFTVAESGQVHRMYCALPGFVDSKNEEKTERNAGYLVVSHSGGGMLRQGTRKGIRRTPANRGMRAHRIVKSLDISEDVCHGLCP